MVPYYKFSREVRLFLRAMFNENHYQNQEWPRIIDEDKTQLKVTVQRSVVKKIMGAMEWVHKAPLDIIHNICCFCFRNPITLNFPILVPLKSPLRASVSSMVIHGSSQNVNIELKIINTWQGRKSDNDNIMLMVQHFTEFICLEAMEIEESGTGTGRSREKWNIVGKHPHHIKGLLRVIGNYRLEGKLNLSIIQAFKKLMKNNIALVKVNGYHFIYLYSHFPSEEKPEIILSEHLKISFTSRLDGWQANLSDPEFGIWAECSEIVSRGITKILTRSGREMQISDIHLFT